MRTIKKCLLKCLNSYIRLLLYVKNTWDSKEESSLCNISRKLAKKVFYRLGRSYQNGLPYMETTITDLILEQFKEEARSQIEIIKYSARAEGYSTGADWEWIFKDQKQFYKVRVQAKRLYLESMRYDALKDSQTQVAQLIAAARAVKAFPVYVLYNSFFKMDSNTDENSETPSLFGCGLVSALKAEKLISEGRVGLNDLLPVQTPWHHLFCTSSDLRVSLPEGVKLFLENNLDLSSDLKTPLRPLEDLHEYVKIGKTQRAPEGLCGVIVFHDKNF